MLIGIWDNSYTEPTFLGINYGQRGAIHCNGTFFYRYISLCRVVTKGISPRAIVFLNGFTNANLIYMALYNMTIETVTHGHATLKIDQSTFFQVIEIRFLQRFINGSHAIGAVTENLNYGQADAIVRYTLVNFHF